MKKFSYVMLACMMFCFLGWTFYQTNGWLYSTFFCTLAGWVAMKIDDERS